MNRERGLVTDGRPLRGANTTESETAGKSG
jgi:hypothetical protein